MQKEKQEIFNEIQKDDDYFLKRGYSYYQKFVDKTSDTYCFPIDNNSGVFFTCHLLIKI